MNLENKKRVVAAAIATAAAVPTAALSQTVVGGRYDSTAPVVAIEDIRNFLKAGEQAEVTRGANFRRDSEACYTNPAPAAGQSRQALAPIKPVEAKKGNKYAGKSMQELSTDAVAIEKMPYNTPEERAKKDAERAEIRDALREQVTRGAAANQQKQSATSFTAPLPQPGGGKVGTAMAEASARQMQAATNPAIQACLTEVETKYQDNSTPMQITYQDSLFEAAGKMLDGGRKEGTRTVHVTLDNGDRYNVVTKNGPYSSRIQPLDYAMKVAANTRNVAPDYGNTAQGQGGEKSSIQLIQEAAERAKRAAEAAKIR